MLLSPHMLNAQLFRMAYFQVVYLVARVLVSMEVMESLPSSSTSAAS